MRKGIVMAEGRRGFVVLTPEGEFVEVPGRPDAARRRRLAGPSAAGRRHPPWRRRPPIRPDGPTGPLWRGAASR